MIKKEFAERFWRNTKLEHKVEAERMVDIFLNTMKEELEKGEVLIFKGFGSFEVKQRTKDEGRNPRTGEVVKFTPKKYVRFKIGKDLSEKINKR